MSSVGRVAHRAFAGWGFDDGVAVGSEPQDVAGKGGVVADRFKLGAELEAISHNATIASDILTLGANGYAIVETPAGEGTVRYTAN